GGSLVPGLIDSHCHPFEYGWLKRNVDLRGTTNITGIRLRLFSAVEKAKPGEWVTGMGWDQETFSERRMPNRLDIDDVSPANPVALSRICGHIALLNGKAIEVLGLQARMGTEYERESGGELTGIVKESALTEVFDKVPRSPERAAADLQSVEVEAGRMGLTTLHCILSPEGFADELEALAILDASRTLSLRFRVYIPPEALDYVESKGLRESMSNDRLRLNGVKIYADGSLGARTAALREPYSDDPSNSGILRQTDEELEALVGRVDAMGYQVIIHAIGDRAIEQAVDALAGVAGSKNPKRHRIEHASLLPKDLRSKMAHYGIRASVQPLFITSDTWAAARLGERAGDLYPLKSMLDEGLIASGSSDSPVESISPVLGMWASMVRGGIAPDESLTPAQALGLYTSNSASNGFDETGSALVEGGHADMTLFDSDVEGMHPALFRKVGVAATIVDGSVIHSFGGA
ncbi:MAG TPA: amidohydrolase, partial [Nitrososphaerales archaeon]|nr:amidohydrolase [Nitrososphaerales archaeon]